MPNNDHKSTGQLASVSIPSEMILSTKQPCWLLTIKEIILFFPDPIFSQQIRRD